MKSLVALIALATIALRLICPHIPPSLAGTYMALAHVFMGILIGAWLITRQRFYLFAFLIPTICEGVAFFVLP